MDCNGGSGQRNYTLNPAAGSYSPSAFYFRLNKIAFQIVNGSVHVSKEEFLVFIHEYSHLVQDMTSLFGAVRFGLIISCLEGLNKLCKSTNPVLVPLSQLVVNGLIIGTNEECAYTQAIEIISFLEPRTEYLPRSNFKYKSYQLENKQCVWTGTQDTSPTNLTRPIVCYEDLENGGFFNYPFGAIEILEAYARAIEEIHGAGKATIDTRFEYRAARVIIEEILGPVTPQETIAICHWSLQYSQPGALFFILLEELKNIKRVHHNQAEVFFDCCRKYVLSNGYKDLQKQLISQLKEQWKIQSSGMPTDHLSEALKWHYEKVSSLLSINQDMGQRFPIDTLFCDANIPVTEGLEALFSLIPVPCAEDKHGVTCSFGGDDRSGQYVLLLFDTDTIIRQLWYHTNATWPCSRFEQCKMASKCDSCNTTPWIQGKIRPPCSFGAASFYLGLHDKQLVSGFNGKAFIPLADDE